MESTFKLSFSLLHKLVAYLIAGLGLFALTLGAELSTLTVALIVVGYAASFFAEGPLLSHSRYGPSWTLAVVLFLAFQIARAITGEITLAMAIEFAAFLQISRLFNRRSGADYQQIAVLAFLHLAAATILTTSVTYAAVFLGFVVVTPWMLALCNLRRQIESNYTASGQPDELALTGIRRVLASKRVVGPGFLLGTAALSVPLFLTTLAIFVVVPRVGQGFFGFQRGNEHRVAGFGDKLELGGLGLIRDDPTVVVRVTPLPEPPRNPTQASYRLRGTSFDRYDGRRWTRTPSRGKLLPRGYYYPIARWPSPRSDRRLRIVVERLEEKVVFLPEGTVAVQIHSRAEGGSWSELRLVRSAGLDIRYLDEDGLSLLYTAYTSPSAAPVGGESIGLGCSALDCEPLERYLQMPPGHRAVIELARQVTAGARTEIEKIARLVHYLRDSGRFRYSLMQPDVGDRPPLEIFLLKARAGHCEYFSSALAVMLRAVGVPSRNVTGFLGGRYNPYGRYYALRQGEAHSWVEAFVAGRGWITVDPTPPSGANAGPPEGWRQELYALIDALRARWTASVIAYDVYTQIRMLYKLRGWALSMRGAFDFDFARGGAGRFSGSSGGRRLLGWTAAAAAIGAIAWAIYRWRRRRSGEASLPKRVSRAVALYRELERALQKRGYPRPIYRTPWEHAHQLSEDRFAQIDEVREVTGRYMQVRYGEGSIDADEMEALRSKIARVRSGTEARPQAV